MSVSFSGFNGIDFGSIIDATINAESAPLNALKQQQNNKKAVLPSDIVAINAADAKHVPAKSVIIEQPSSIKIEETLTSPAMRSIPKPVPSGITVQTEDLKQQRTQVQTQKTQASEQINLPAALKGTSADPDARPVMPAVKDATVPVKKD